MQDLAQGEQIGMPDEGFDPNEWNDAEAWLRGADFFDGDAVQNDDV